MEEKTTLKISDMKKISHEIIDEELKKYNIKTNVFPLTFIEYYNNYVFNKKHTLIQKASDFVTPLIGNMLAFNNLKEKDIVIFLNRIDKIEKVDNVFLLAKICYHEVRHSIQQNFDNYSYEGFLRDIDYLRTNKIDYQVEHDSFSFEIGANLYGISKAKEYIKKNYPNLYENKKNKIEQIERSYQFDYMMYDASDNIEKTLSILKNNDNYRNNLNKISPVLEIFLNKDANFKNFGEIIQNNKFYKLDKRIIYAFLSCKSFLEQIDMNYLTVEELKIVNESLQYTNNLYKNQSKAIEQFLKNKKINYLEYLKAQKSIIKKVDIIGNHYLKKVFNVLNGKNKSRKAHKESIPTYLEKSHQLVKKRQSNGYLLIAMFYILGMVISISTTIFILFFS